MLAPSGNILTHVVTLYQYVYGLDDDRSRVRTANAPTITTGVPCSVLPGATARTVEEGRINQTTDYEVQFVTDYGLQVEDEIEWHDGARDHLITVSGVTRSAGRGVFVLTGKELV